jgi:ATP-dependent helicase/nuclease subunit B
MPIERKFLGLDHASLPLAADYLAVRYHLGAALDLSQVLVVVPGAQAGRRLLELLVDCSQRRSIRLTPPQIETVGRVPERLYLPQRPFATDLIQQLAWARVLRDCDRDKLRSILVPPAEGDDLRWLEYGRLFWRLYQEVAADGLDFAQVAKRGQQIKQFPERSRWSVLHDLQQAYLRMLDRLELWDIQMARQVAIEQRECHTDCDLILVGAADMTVLLRKMLDQVSDRVTTLVFAPESWHDRFDRHGCLIPSAWQSVTIDLPHHPVHVVEGPAEQADRVARCLADFEGRYRADEITIGLADEAAAPLIQRQLQQCEIRSRYAGGVPLSRTSPYRLIAAVLAFLRSGSYTDFAALVRHPDADQYLQQQGVAPTWLDDLDEYYRRHLPDRWGTTWVRDPCGQSVADAYSKIQRCLGEFDSSIRPMIQWANPLRSLVTTVYGGRDWNQQDASQRMVLHVLRRLQEVLEEQIEPIPQRLMPSLPAADMLQLVLDQLQSDCLPVPTDAGAVHLAGWLELALDDAPALIVCGLNEGLVPSSVNADLFLPDALRSRLGLQDNQRRYARDAYALSVLMATRQHLHAIVTRRNLDGDPLAPSRLLFATDPQTLAARALKFFSPPTPVHELPPLAGVLTAGQRASDFPIPQPVPLDQPINSMRVTAFRDYLACPYRFYLRHVLGLRPVDDRAEELDGAAFGNLLHDVMYRFGNDPLRDATDPDQIRQLLEELLDQRVAELFGQRPMAAVGVQVEQLRQRLQTFAEFQAGWAQQGWRIRHIEVPSGDQAGVEFLVDDLPFLLRGRIDRVDVHRDTGEIAVLDYKTSDLAKTPDAVHRRSRQWVDLQLPLYRHLVASLGISRPVRLGYLLLPRDLSSIDVAFAPWTPEELHQADEVARSVVRAVRQQQFWPPADPPPDFAEDFAPICQDSVFDRPQINRRPTPA